MRAIEIVGSGAAAVLRLGEAPDPRPGAGEVLIDVAATAVNRADLLQRRGFYPPPPGASPVLGLECSGTIAELGAGVDGWRVGDRVCALLPGGGYAERATAHAGSLLPVPSSLSLIEAAGLPEVFLTCSLNLFQLAAAKRGDWVLVHGGSSGIGTAAIQLLKHEGAHTVVTAGTAEKCRGCLDLGAELALNYKELGGTFAPAVLEATNRRGVDVVLDSIGASYLPQHLDVLAMGGRLVVIGLMGGARSEIDLGKLVGKRISILGSTLRVRPPEEKARIVAYFRERFWGAVESGEIRPIVHAVMPWAEAQAAHDLVEASTHFGKVVLQVGTV